MLFPIKSGRVLSLPVDRIAPNPDQPRRHFDPAALEELAASIRSHGILQPLTVRQTGDRWELVAGERRLRAARLAGLAEVPCLPVQADNTASAALALMENLQREDLHYLEEAAAIRRLVEGFGLTQEEVARQLGKSPSAVANKLRLLRLSPACTAILLEHHLSERHARALLRLEDEEERLAAVRHMAAKGLNVAQADAYVEARLQAMQRTEPKGRKAYIIKDVRLFLNSIDRGLRLMREAGVDAGVERQEQGDEILLTIRIPRARRDSRVKIG